MIFFHFMFSCSEDPDHLGYFNKSDHSEMIEMTNKNACLIVPNSCFVKTGFHSRVSHGEIIVSDR